MADVPDVGGLTEEEARAQLEEQGFKVEVVYSYNDGSYTAGEVKSSGGIAPEEGTSVPVGETIIIQVYGEVETTTAPPETTIASNATSSD